MSVTTSPGPVYPVHVDAQLEAHLSRWLWLVKWVLLIPHYLVLALLWVAFVVMSMVAFVAILFTGHYPRAIFDFNVGVLRWSWRVGYYSYGALGTDRYPPFTLQERPDYPAHLQVDYPERLSRGLVLVKWWLLALPHYLVVGIFLGGAGYTASQVESQNETWSGIGLIGLLVLVGAVALLVTGRYPRSLFDLLLGLNRWVLRVAAYAALMTDTYPPFRLDQGGDEPDGRLLFGTAAPADPAPAEAPKHAAPSAPPTAPGTPETRWSAGRVVALVIGCLLAASGLLTGTAAVATSALDNLARDGDGFLMTPTTTLASPTYAVTSPAMELRVDDGVPGLAPEAVIGQLRLVAAPRTQAPLFLGIASTADVDQWLGDAAHAVVLDGYDAPRYRTEGSASTPAAAPGDTDIWVASSEGTGRQSLTWTPQDGDWTVVMMNADGSAGVAAAVRAGATVPVLDWATAQLWWTTVVLLALGALVITLAVRSVPRAE